MKAEMGSIEKSREWFGYPIVGDDDVLGSFREYGGGVRTDIECLVDQGDPFDIKAHHRGRYCINGYRVGPGKQNARHHRVARQRTVTFASDPVWATGTPVRVSATGGGLSSSTTYFARSIGGGIYSFFDSAVNATNTDASPDPLNGRKDLTAAITASVFANLTTVSFDNDHNWATGTVVRVAASGGGLALGTN